MIIGVNIEINLFFNSVNKEYPTHPNKPQKIKFNTTNTKTYKYGIV
jgi:hypothetical protein